LLQLLVRHVRYSWRMKDIGSSAAHGARRVMSAWANTLLGLRHGNEWVRIAQGCPVAGSPAGARF